MIRGKFSARREFTARSQKARKIGAEHRADVLILKT
jgi:hypothetical protein